MIVNRRFDRGRPKI